MNLDKYIYLDNNGTTFMPSRVKDEIYRWMNKGNPSTIYAPDVGTPELIGRLRAKVASVHEFEPADYSVIITSGASETNNFVLRAAVAGFVQCTHRQPHIIITAVEHKSLYECAADLKANCKIELSIVPPGPDGSIGWKEVEPHIQSNTCLVCVMFANNETGIINGIEEIGDHLSRTKPSIPFYVDAVQTFGKFPVRPVRRHITAFGGSFHKLYGPPGIGVCVMMNSFIEGYKIRAEICGSQNFGLRGGTENIPYIAGAIECMKYTFMSREFKNKELVSLQIYTLRALMGKVPTSFFMNWTADNIASVSGMPNYKGSGRPPNVEMVVMGTDSLDPGERFRHILPNTLMISFITHNVGAKVVGGADLFGRNYTKSNTESFVEGGGNPAVNARPICNYKMAKLLMDRGIIIGMGSACNTGKPSYVLEAMNVPIVVANGSVRISFGDDNCEADACTLVREILCGLQTLLK